MQGGGDSIGVEDSAGTVKEAPMWEMYRVSGASTSTLTYTSH